MDHDFKQRPGDQPLPVPNDQESTQESFLRRINEDMPERMQVGLRRYGTLLQPFNGRDYGLDAWEELLDLAVYLEGVRRERDAMIELLRDVTKIGLYGDRTNNDVRDRARVMLLSMGQSLNLGEGSVDGSRS